MTLLLVSIFGSFGCHQPKQAPTRVSQEKQNTGDTQDFFQKKLECSRLLPRMKVPPVKGVEELRHIVFYSPKLNTCIGISGAILTGKTVVPPFKEFRVRTFYVDDLLTNQGLEYQTFDLNITQQAKAARNYEEEVIKRYGGQVP